VASFHQFAKKGKEKTLFLPVLSFPAKFHNFSKMKKKEEPRNKFGAMFFFFQFFDLTSGELLLKHMFKKTILVFFSHKIERKLTSIQFKIK
jgi:hypothetical protein